MMASRRMVRRLENECAGLEEGINIFQEVER
jgi:hypothetical protein